MQEDLGLTNTQAGALATGNFVGYLIFALIGGFLVTHFSHRSVITIALLVVAIATALTATSSGFIPALVWRTLTGMGSGCSNVPMMGLLSVWFSPKRRGLATGIAVTGSSLGLIITGPLVPYILNIFGENGWRYAWVALGAIVFLIALLAFVFLRDRPRDRGIHPIGADADTPDAQSDTRSAENKVQKASASWSLVYKSGAVWQLAFIYVTFGFSYIIYVTFFAKYLQNEIGLSKESAGNLWQMVGWISIFCGIIWGWVSDIIGRKYALALVSFIQGSTYLIFAMWTTHIGLVVSTVLFGLTSWSIPAIMASACGDQLGSRLAPAALGFITLFFGIGQALGPTVAGGISDLAGSFSPAFIVAGAVAYLGALASFTIRRPPVTGMA